MSESSSVVRQAFIPLLKVASVKHIGEAIVAGSAAFVTIFALAALTRVSGQLLLIAPFGASCVLVFALPDSPLAQNRNLIGGHIISAAIGLAILSVLGTSPIAYGAGVGCAITAMVLTKTVHPPAGANPIVVIAAGSSWGFLLAPILSGTLMVAAFAWIWRLSRRWMAVQPK